MTGIFTYRNFSLEDVPDLKERVAVVTVNHPGIHTNQG
jgi:multidrug efflux pump subunit AcrB